MKNGVEKWGQVINLTLLKKAVNINSKNGRIYAINKVIRFSI